MKTVPHTLWLSQFEMPIPPVSFPYQSRFNHAPSTLPAPAPTTLPSAPRQFLNNTTISKPSACVFQDKKNPSPSPTEKEDYTNTPPPLPRLSYPYLSRPRTRHQPPLHFLHQHPRRQRKNRTRTAERVRISLRSLWGRRRCMFVSGLSFPLRDRKASRP